MRKTLLAAALISAAAPAIAEDYHRATALEQAKAYCEVFANQVQTPAGLIAGYAIHAKNYDSCMVLKGYARNQ
jgi:hypothetical protein